MKNANTRDRLDEIRTTVLRNLAQLPAAPSAQMQVAPPKTEMVSGGGAVQGSTGQAWRSLDPCDHSSTVQPKRRMAQAELPPRAVGSALFCGPRMLWLTLPCGRAWLFAGGGGG